MNDKGFGLRIPVEARFPVTIQTDPGAYYHSTMGVMSLYQVVKRPGRDFDHQSPPWSRLKKGYSYFSAPSYGMLQSVLYFNLNIKVTFWVRPSPHNAFMILTNRLLTSLPVASVSYHTCTDKPVTCHVMVQRYGQYYMLVTSFSEATVTWHCPWYPKFVML